MTERMGLPGGPIHLNLIGFDPYGLLREPRSKSSCPPRPFAQLLEHGATGAVESANLVLTEQGAEVRTLRDS